MRRPRYLDALTRSVDWDHSRFAGFLLSWHCVHIPSDSPPRVRVISLPDTSSLTKCRVAIWGRSFTILIFTACVWFCNLGFSVYSKNHFVLAPFLFLPYSSSTESPIFSPGVTRGAIVWVPSVNACFITKTSGFRWGITVNFISVEILLSVMFAGVLNKRNASGLWRVLYIQVRSRFERFSEQCLHKSLRVLRGFFLHP